MQNQSCLKLFFLFLIIISVYSCGGSDKGSFSNREVKDLPLILENRKMIVITDYNSTDYFIYRGQPMGYQYELLQDLADHLDIELEIIVSNNLEENFNCLMMGDCDLIAINLTVTQERKEKFSFTVPHSQTHQVLVQRKPDGWEKMSPNQIERNLIRKPLELGGKKVYVQQHSSYTERLRNLSEEIGDSIEVIDVPEEAEMLIMMVSNSEIDYTVCDENVALVNQTYFPNLDVQTAVSFSQNLAWAVNSEAEELLNEINTWLTDYRETARYYVIYNKYFKNPRSAKMMQSELFTLSSGKISKYDEYLKEYAALIDWDWRLLASLIYQESRFNPNARSWAGAFGLMQLMPGTANRFGVSRSSSASQQIKAGTDFIRWLDNRFIDDISDPEERVKFILASYNVGPGHIFDAMTLARKNGKDPNKWEDNVDEYLLKKSNPVYYRDPDVKYGYARGIETYNYVREVLERYEHYKNVIEEASDESS
jgi:membrane-bound lytic murein transglycosylase F